MELINLLQLLCGFISLTYGQRLPPGVNPQHYQQQQGQYQQYQQVPIQQGHQQVPVHQVPVQGQVPVQHQQVPVQHQQVPVQHQQVPVQHQQVPVQHQQGHGQHQQGGHHHAHPPPQPNQILNAANIAHEKEHIQEHMEVPIDTSKMSDQELQFHYFKMHDADNNNKLDGCELIKSLIHWHDPTTRNAKLVLDDDELARTVDLLLDGWDLTKDGYIDYTEFKILSRGN